jgi:hypothetical protein
MKMSCCILNCYEDQVSGNMCVCDTSEEPSADGHQKSRGLDSAATGDKFWQIPSETRSRSFLNQISRWEGSLASTLISGLPDPKQKGPAKLCYWLTETNLLHL